MPIEDGTNLFIYKGTVFLLDGCPQGPDPYSLFLEQNITAYPHDVALDITTGCGFHAIMMAPQVSRVVAVDVVETAVRCARRNVLLNGLEERVEVRAGDLYEALSDKEKFDLIVAWPPVMPTPPDKARHDPIGLANDGGRDGRRVIDRLILEAAQHLNRGGRLQILHAWYNNVPKSMEMLRSLGFEAKITAEREFQLGRISFERLGYLAELGFPASEIDGVPMQRHFVVTATLPP